MKGEGWRVEGGGWRVEVVKSIPYGARVSGEGCGQNFGRRVEGFEYRVSGAGLRVEVAEFQVQGRGFLGFRVQGVGVRGEGPGGTQQPLRPEKAPRVPELALNAPRHHPALSFVFSLMSAVEPV